MAWKNLTDGSFKGFRFHTSKPKKGGDVHGISSQKTTKARRLQIVKKPRVDGGGINDFGADPDTIEVDIIFFGADYLKKYEEFLSLCSDGKPGILVVPVRSRAVVAYFQQVTETTEVGSGGTIRASVSFVEDTTIDPVELETASTSVVPNSLQKASALSEKLDAAKKILNSNPLIDAVRFAESGISTVRRYANTVIQLDQNIRNRITSVTNEINGTIDLVKGAVSIFKKDKVPSTANTGNLIDPETGQEVVPFDQVDEPTEADDILDQPDPTPITSENTPELSDSNLVSNAGIEVFTTKASELVKAQREEMALLGGGKTDDISKSLTQVIIALDDFRASIATKAGTPVLVPNDLSIVEIMFHNGIDLNDLSRVISNNRHVSDPLAVDAGTVVYL